MEDPRQIRHRIGEQTTHHTVCGTGEGDPTNVIQYVGQLARSKGRGPMDLNWLPGFWPALLMALWPLSLCPPGIQSLHTALPISSPIRNECCSIPVLKLEQSRGLNYASNLVPAVSLEVFYCRTDL